jgi:hypothetical protein
MMMKLPKKLLEIVKPQTKADSELNPTLQCPAPTCGNALLAVGFFVRMQTLRGVEPSLQSLKDSCRPLDSILLFQSPVLQSFLLLQGYPKM